LNDRNICKKIKYIIYINGKRNYTKLYNEAAGLLRRNVFLPGSPVFWGVNRRGRCYG